MNDSDRGSDLQQSQRTAAEWLALVLELITSSSSIADLSVEAVRTATGLPLEQFDEGQFGTAERLTPDWSFVLKKDDQSMWGADLEFEFFSDGDANVPMTDIAQLDFDAFAGALTEQGFNQETIYGEHGQVISHEFSRHQLKVTVLTRDEGGDLGRPAHSCVRWVIIR